MIDLAGTISFPILERIPIVGDLAVSPHGLGIAIGFGLGAVMMARRARERGVGYVYVEDVSEAISDLLIRVALGAIIGARFFYVLTHLDDFQGEWLRVFAAWEGGLTFLGGVAGAVIFAIPYAKRRGWKTSMLLDSAAPGLAFGLAIGRLGDLMIGDHIGAPTDFVLGWRCTANYWVQSTNSFGRIEPLPYPTGEIAPTAGCFDVAVHQTALYDFGATVVVLVVLLLMERRRWFDGAFAAAWVWVYGALRFTSDFARSDRTWFGLTGSQWAILGTMALTLALVQRLRPWRRERWAWDRVFDHPWKQPTFRAEDFEVAEGPLLVGSGDRTRPAHAVLSAAQVAPVSVGAEVDPQTGDGEPAAAQDGFASGVPSEREERTSLGRDTGQGQGGEDAFSAPSVPRRAFPLFGPRSDPEPSDPSPESAPTVEPTPPTPPASRSSNDPWTLEIPDPTPDPETTEPDSPEPRQPDPRPAEPQQPTDRPSPRGPERPRPRDPDAGPRMASKRRRPESGV